MRVSLDDYLQGVPLSEENAALMNGEDLPQNRPAAAPVPRSQASAQQFVMDDDKREWLQRLVREPGYAILLDYIAEMVAKREKSAAAMSQIDPVANQSNLVKEWTYVAAMKQVLVLIVAGVTQEIELLGQRGESDNGEILGE